ncbi:MAG: non-canonical purine NTP pyrophosphatase, RdgB/HAM1 family [Treponema sp. GWB1_62_6]|nr:MAG: non-canonical purine NTP pyrophosphatase, RdgB/HAM1 family [Treponema sp. GWB1_62_6]OHE66966.1 MAG: non-canonical purine NTP pyrophosphatase, RdgB/HAM1 family [Treponema sp. GWC1_61_84]OHE75561.1 MAG: non-canonical purine NTP pyrophosphatase, RdgB/HAM1 family [Treponema sp. RIFOXYC1_FULL_61_9]HCM25482.1 non-canonical purine NTP pyrophosphatase, RdgB/HAM1 family [Treponema sp.]
MTIWFATGNAHKKKELAAILPGHRIRIPAEAGIDFDPDETGETFLDNALIKARELYALVREPVIADDSGLCVDALGGRPGVMSARYGSGNGEKLESADRNELLLRELGGAKDRGARFVCSMVLLLSEDRFFVAQETFEGTIVTEGRGSGGFGYDPILFLPEFGRTVAELSDDEKNRLSHRGKAGERIRAILDTL